MNEPISGEMITRAVQGLKALDVRAVHCTPCLDAQELVRFYQARASQEGWEAGRSWQRASDEALRYASRLHETECALATILTNGIEP